jgi:hypothetical protein
MVDDNKKDLIGSYYSPPYDSPIEDLFAYNIVKYLNAASNLLTQYEVVTICGIYRLDFVIEHNEEIIAFECDGKEYHDWQRDEWRDAMILGSKKVNLIYRLRGSDLYKHIEDCLHLISQEHPYLFSDRGIVNLNNLASKEAKNHIWRKTPSFLSLVYMHENETLNENDVVMIDIRSQLDTRLWNYFKWALDQGGGKLEELMAIYKNKFEKEYVY